MIFISKYISKITFMNKLIFKKSKPYTSLSPFIWVTYFAFINPFVVKYNTCRKYTKRKYIVH